MGNINQKMKIALLLITTVFINISCDQNVGKRDIEKSNIIEN